ncbi:MAG: class I SAM-dependent methyltransferase [Candidatus Bathyarchaeota archaeon]|nr:MAG: class I SAM-dependent methyltransferase [Candidatus Bathyarchaeota archaeon]
MVFWFFPFLLGAPWFPTSMGTVRRMLLMAGVKPGDVVYDLGSGDGRIIVTAAKEFGARSVGIEVNPLWVWWTRLRIGVLGLRDHVEVIRGNFFREHLGEADVVTLYLLQGTNDRLRRKLEKELKPGARVVTHVYTFKGWRPLTVDNESEIYLYKIGDHRDPAYR